MCYRHCLQSEIKKFKSRYLSNIETTYVLDRYYYFNFPWFYCCNISYLVSILSFIYMFLQLPIKDFFWLRNNCRVEIWNKPNFFHRSLPFYAIQIINLFLNSRISANHDKLERISSNGFNCFSLVESLFFQYSQAKKLVFLSTQENIVFLFYFLTLRILIKKVFDGI